MKKFFFVAITAMALMLTACSTVKVEPLPQTIPATQTEAKKVIRQFTKTIPVKSNLKEINFKTFTRPCKIKTETSYLIAKSIYTAKTANQGKIMAAFTKLMKEDHYKSKISKTKEGYTEITYTREGYTVQAIEVTGIKVASTSATQAIFFSITTPCAKKASS